MSKSKEIMATFQHNYLGSIIDQCLATKSPRFSSLLLIIIFRFQLLNESSRVLIKSLGYYHQFPTQNKRLPRWVIVPEIVLDHLKHREIVRFPGNWELQILFKHFAIGQHFKIPKRAARSNPDSRNAQLACEYLFYQLQNPRAQPLWKGKTTHNPIGYALLNWNSLIRLKRQERTNWQVGLPGQHDHSHGFFLYFTAEDSQVFNRRAEAQTNKHLQVDKAARGGGSEENPELIVWLTV